MKYYIRDLFIENIRRKCALEAISSPYLISINSLTQQIQVRISFLDYRFCMEIIEKPHNIFLSLTPVPFDGHSWQK